MKKIVILGATGSIGTSALDVIAGHPDKFTVLALTAGSNVELLAKQIKIFRPRFVVTAQKEGADFLRSHVALNGTQIAYGASALLEAATLPEADLVLSAIVGARGIQPTYAALRAGKTVALANKESLVAGGAVILQALREGGGTLIPVDSEHSAIHQVLQGGNGVARIILTASGGPFRNTSLADLKKVTLEQALKHPNWSMGAKITIDSATLMNKGLEMIEARWLFDIPAKKIAVKIHPQSIVHSLVEFVDGSVLAQLGLPDMRTPIAYALGFPERIGSGVASLDLVAKSPLTFEEPDEERFPSLRLAREALEAEGSAPCVFNAANEVAVEAFLAKKISFLQIFDIVEKTLSAHSLTKLTNMEEVLATDQWARRQASSL